jgi:hypothetical protein
MTNHTWARAHATLFGGNLWGKFGPHALHHSVSSEIVSLRDDQEECLALSKSSRRLMGVAPVGHSEGGLLVIFKRYLLRQHNVADREVPLGAEAPSGSAFAVFVELVHK